MSIINGVEKYTVNGVGVLNEGFEFSLRFTPFNNMLNKATANGGSQGFRWTFDPNFGSVFNQLMGKMRRKDKALQPPVSIDQYLNGFAYVDGRPVNTLYSFKFLGLDHETGAPRFAGTERYYTTYDENGNEVLNQWKDVYDKMKKEDVWMERVLVHSGRREPFLQGGINNSFQYNNMILSFNLTYSIGSKIRLFRMYNNGGSLPQPNRNLRRDWLDRWMVPGDEKHTTIPAIVGGSVYAEMTKPWFTANNNNPWSWADSYWKMYDYSDLRVASGNYLKLSSIQFRYMVPEGICGRFGMKAAYASVSATNVFTICDRKLKGQSPTQSGTTSLINISARPTYSLTLNVSFYVNIKFV